MPYTHQPVLLKETINYLNIKQDGLYVDGTLGRGGHSQAILNNLSDRGMVIGIDRDWQAIAAARKKILKNKKKYKVNSG